MPFATAHAAVDAHDLDGLRALLDAEPALVSARAGDNANDLLGMATATRDARLVALLLERGADPAAANVHGWTALHQAAYGGSPVLARQLLDAGAPIAAEARGAGGTPLVIALFWGHVRTAELLARVSRAPGNLRVAAGLGLLGGIERLLGAGRSASAAAAATPTPIPTPIPLAGAAREFHRPHGGFPAWEPANAPQEIVDEALSWAARNDRADALDLLVAHGAQLDADVYRGTALAWAAACGRDAAVARLLALGADPNARTSFGGPGHGERATALHLAAEAGRLAAIRLLLGAGADPADRDGRHDATPADWAAHAGSDAAAALLRT